MAIKDENKAYCEYCKKYRSLRKDYWVIKYPATYTYKLIAGKFNKTNKVCAFEKCNCCSVCGSLMTRILYRKQCDNIKLNKETRERKKYKKKCKKPDLGGIWKKHIGFKLGQQ